MRPRTGDRVRFLSTILENVTDSVVVMDLEGRIRHWNHGAEALFGYTADEMIGQTPANLWPENKPVTLAASLARVLQGHDYVGEWNARRKDGSTFWIDNVTRVMRDDAGEVVGFISVSTDSTRRKQAEQARDRVMALLSHDLQNPLTTVTLSAVALSQQIVANKPAAALAPHVDRILKAGEMMSSMIRSLMDLARIDSGQILGTLGVYSASVMLAKAADAFATLVAEKRQRLVTKPIDESVKVTCNGDRIMQVFSNLIGNASRHAPPATTIVLSARLCGDLVEFAVRDEGPGIPPEELPHVFERFRRSSRHPGGLGLGLSIVTGIIEAHGGRVWAESALGSGSTFWFSLPVERNA